MDARCRFALVVMTITCIVLCAHASIDSLINVEPLNTLKDRFDMYTWTSYTNVSNGADGVKYINTGESMTFAGAAAHCRSMGYGFFNNSYFGVSLE